MAACGSTHSARTICPDGERVLAQLDNAVGPSLVQLVAGQNATDFWATTAMVPSAWNYGDLSVLGYLLTRTDQTAHAITELRDCLNDDGVRTGRGAGEPGFPIHQHLTCGCRDAGPHGRRGRGGVPRGIQRVLADAGVDLRLRKR